MITLTAGELRSFIDREGNWNPRLDMTVRVRVVDARQSYGRVDFKIKPTAGTGASWVDSGGVKLDSVEVETKGGAKTKS